MSETPRLPWRFSLYQRESDAKWCVFAVYDETPEWSRLIGEFPSKDRARTYCEIENDIADCGDVDCAKDIAPAPATLPDEPRNNVTPENFAAPRMPSPAEKARVGAHLIGEAAEESGDGDAVVRVGRGSKQGAVPLPEGEHGRRRGAILQAIKDHIEEEERFPSLTEIAERSGVSQGSLSTYLAQLEQQGELTKDENGCRYLKAQPEFKAQQKPGSETASKKEAVLAVIIESYATGRGFPMWGELASKSGIPKGSMQYALDALEKDGDIVRDKNDMRCLKGHERDGGTIVPHPAPTEPARLKIRPEVAAAVASFPAQKPRIGRPPTNPGPESLDHKMQRRCQGCSSIFETDSIQQYLCDDCDRSAARLA